MNEFWSSVKVESFSLDHQVSGENEFTTPFTIRQMTLIDAHLIATTRAFFMPPASIPPPISSFSLNPSGIQIFTTW